ncbi:MAG: glycosyltransferase [Rhodobacteraceae bacterium]|nr:glycosyltransferase [Paracoccaceae bacterium]
MKILLVHQNFPGQFVHLAPALKQRGHQVLALTCESNTRPSPVEVAKYRTPPKVNTGPGLSRHFASCAERGAKAALAARQLRDRHGFVPDVIFGHSGWGETLFLKEIWPEARLLIYAELMYRATGLDSGFDPEFPRNELDARLLITARSAHLVQAMVQADAALCPTAFQAATFPKILRDKITICHDGIDTDVVRPNPEARLDIPGTTLSFRPGDEVISFVSRSLEPYRGYHSFMRALPQVLATRPGAHVVIVGAEGQSYGPAPRDGLSWKARYLDEIRDRCDLSRVHFLGRVPYARYLSLLQVSRAHAYLTYPFVLGWSLLEAMAAEAHVIASDTAPVREVIEDGRNGRLVDFFDIEGWSRTLTEALADPAAGAPLRAAARRDVIARYDLRSQSLPRLMDFVENAGQ